MNKSDTILPDSLAIYPHMMAFDIAVKEWLDDLKLEVLLVYLVDQVSAKALPALAEQFDVLGYKGWNLCSTDDERRALIKRAIELHRYKGTLWAVKESLKSIGFNDVTIAEHVNGHWARFSLTLDNENVQIGADGFTNIIAMVEEYKPVRSYLDGVIINITVNDDDVNLENDEADVFDEILAEDTIFINGSLFYDGTGDYDGTHDHSGDADTITIT